MRDSPPEPRSSTSRSADGRWRHPDGRGASCLTRPEPTYDTTARIVRPDDDFHDTERRMTLHGLLARQLRRLGLEDPSKPPTAEEWAQLLERVSKAYVNA